MKESIRTASVLEIYNSSIDDLKKQKNTLDLKLNTLKASKIAQVFTSIIINTLLSFVIFFSFFGIIASIESAPSLDFIYLLYLFFGGLSIWGIVSHNKSRVKKKLQIEKEIQEVKSKIKVIRDEIDKKKVRKQSLLNAEEVIISKDLRASQEYVDTEKFSKSVVNNELEKVCPMCAENIKKAAIVCRYCGHKFNL